MTKEILNQIKLVPILDSLKLQKIDDEVYFSTRYKDYVSNSRLSLIDPKNCGSPEQFFKGNTGIFTDSIIYGSAIHELCLQKELFHLCFDADRPTGKAGFMADALYPKFLEDEVTEEAIIEASNKISYYKGMMNQDKIDNLLNKCQSYWEHRKEYEAYAKLDTTPIYVDERGREKVQQCVHAIERNKSIQRIMHPKGLLTDPISENEQAILLDMEVTAPDHDPFILKLKSKLDNYTIDTETNTIAVNDIKTIGKMLSEFDCKGGSIDKYSYRREIAMYSFLLQLCAKKYYNMDNPTCKGNFLVVSTIPQYYTKVVPMTKKDFVKGFNEFKYLLRLVAYYYSEGYQWT